MKIAVARKHIPQSEWGLLVLDCDEAGFDLDLALPEATARDSQPHDFRPLMRRVRVTCFVGGHGYVYCGSEHSISLLTKLAIECRRELRRRGLLT